MLVEGWHCLGSYETNGTKLVLPHIATQADDACRRLVIALAHMRLVGSLLLQAQAYYYVPDQH